MKYSLEISILFALLTCFLVVLGQETTLNAADLNLAPDVDENYPVVFNIILFLSVSLILALIAISVAISTMDPGRDSLIYRVTSAQRFKKDN